MYIYHHKKTQEAVSNVEITGIKQKQLNETYPTSAITHILPKFSFFNCKSEIVKKIKCWLTLFFWVSLNITLVLRFMKSNKFYYIQTAKVKNSKNGSS